MDTDSRQKRFANKFSLLLLQYVQLIALCLLEQYAMYVKILISLLIVTVCLLRFKLNTNFKVWVLFMAYTVLVISTKIRILLQLSA